LFAAQAFTLSTAIDIDFQARFNTEHRFFKQIPNARTHQQLWPLEYQRLTHALFCALRLNRSTVFTMSS